MNLDLITPEVVDAAYRAHHVSRRGGKNMVPGEYEATYSRVEVAWLTDALAAAAPLIAAAVAEQIAAAIEASMNRHPPIGATAADAWTNATARAVRIAREAVR